MRAVLTLARRELKNLFDTPAGYVLLVVFLVVNGFLAFRQVYVMGFATLRPMLDTLPWLLLFLVPAVTMRSLAEDTRSGQLEVVLSQPVTEFQLLLGKYLGAVAFLAVALLCTLPIPLGLRVGAPIPWARWWRSTPGRCSSRPASPGWACGRPGWPGARSRHSSCRSL